MATSSYTKFLTTADTQVINPFNNEIGIKHVRTIMSKAQSSETDPSFSQIDLVLRLRRRSRREQRSSGHRICMTPKL